MQKFKIIIQFLVGCCFAFVVLEYFLKISEIKLPYKTFDVQVGKTYLPHALINENREAFYINKTNEFGFIGNVSLQKKPNTIRIAIFGDSFAEAIQLDSKYNFCTILENNLNKKLSGSRRFEVINFGLSNSVLPDVYVRKKRLADKFAIDYYLYFFDSYDLILDTQSILNPILIDDQLKIKPNTSKTVQFYSKIQPLIDNSSFTNMFLEAYILHTRGESKKIILDKFYQPDTTTIDYSYYDYYFKNFPEKNKKILDTLLSEKSLLIFNEKAENELKKTLTKNKIRYYETEKALEKLRKRGINPYYWGNSKMEGHFNYEAHQAVGDFLTEILGKELK